MNRCIRSMTTIAPHPTMSRKGQADCPWRNIWQDSSRLRSSLNPNHSPSPSLNRRRRSLRRLRHQRNLLRMILQRRSLQRRLPRHLLPQNRRQKKQLHLRNSRIRLPRRPRLPRRLRSLSRIPPRILRRRRILRRLRDHKICSGFLRNVTRPAAHCHTEMQLRFT